MSVEVYERRMRVLRAVAAIERYPSMEAVLPYHVRYFGLPECVPDLATATVERDLRWLRDDGYLSSPARARGGRAFFATTLAGRAAVEQAARR